jgi:hypothetical protein
VLSLVKVENISPGHARKVQSATPAKPKRDASHHLLINNFGINNLAINKRITVRHLLLATLLILAGCDTREPVASAWQKPASVTLGCEDYQQIALASGILYNNVWNKHADTTGTGTQCLESREVDGVMEYGWSWNWPRGKRVIYGYPQIKTGSSP